RSWRLSSAAQFVDWPGRRRSRRGNRNGRQQQRQQEFRTFDPTALAANGRGTNWRFMNCHPEWSVYEQALDSGPPGRAAFARDGVIVSLRIGPEAGSPGTRAPGLRRLLRNLGWQ